MGGETGCVQEFGGHQALVKMGKGINFFSFNVGNHVY